MSDAQKRAMYIVIGNEILKTFTGESKISYQSILRECLDEKYTIQEVLDSMTSKQRSVIFFVVKEALEKAVSSELEDLQKLLTKV